MGYKIFENVQLGVGAQIGEFVIIGEPARGKTPGEDRTIIGMAPVIRSHTVVYAGNHIGDNFQTGHHVMIRENNRIGNNVSVGTGTIIEHHVEIADDVRIHSQAFIPEFTQLGKGAWIGPNVVLTNARYPNRPDTKSNLEGVVIGSGAVIGANATLLPGVKIGEGALIGAGSVVTKDVEPGMVCRGAQAVVSRKA